jgi:N-hydroxyarylamine O-acetyltransferase
MTVDLDAYFRRIGCARPRAPTLQALRAIQLAHPQAIAFENINPLLHWPVKLDLPSIEEKLVRGGRGGYCFEQNLLLAAVLRALGFSVRQLAARVLWRQPEDAITPRSHMLLLVDAGGETYVSDVGFGGMTLTAPLRFETDVEQPTPHEPFRLVERDGYFMLQAKVRGEWLPVYRFDLQEQYLTDYEVSNWYLSNFPGSHFVTGLIAARPAPGRRYALSDNVLTVHHTGGESERRVLTSPGELRETLARDFLLRLPDRPEFDAALQRLAARAA